MEFNLDLNNISEIPKDITILKIHNVTNKNYNSVTIPEYIIELELFGKLDELVIPEHIKIMICYSMGLKNIICNDALEYLYCADNELETIILPDDILAIDVSHNKLTSIKVKNKLTSLCSVSICNNLIKDLDIYLPESMFHFDMEGNLPMKIKYANFMFGRSDIFIIIDGDFDKVICNDKLKRFEHIRGRLFDLCRNNITYIDINRLDNDRYFFSFGIKD